MVTDTGTTRLPAHLAAELADDLAAAAPSAGKLTAAAANAQALRLVEAELAGWQVPPTGRERTKWVHAVAELLVDGTPAGPIMAGVRACADKGCPPRAVASFVFGEANRATPKSRADRNVAAILAMRGENDGMGLAALAAAEQAEKRGIRPGERTAIEGER